MVPNDSATNRASRSRFTLAALFERMTVCAIPLAFSRTLGLGSSFLLMAMGLALGFRQGLLALLLFMAASVAADLPASSLSTESSFTRQLTVVMLAAVLCCWYKLRRQDKSKSGALQIP